MRNKIKKETLTKLLEKIDTLSFGFPKSWLKSDRKLISYIFSQETADIFLLLEKGYQTAQRFAEVNSLSLEQANEKLELLANKGLIYRRHGKEGYEYSAYPFVAGFLEFQAGRKDIGKGMLLHTGMYMITSKFGKRMSQTMPFYRTIPHDPDLVEGGKVVPYDDINELLDRHTRFAVAPCLCRMMYKLKPFNKCNHPIETCIETDEYADFFIETGIGREITKEEARKIIEDGKKDGRVINVTNSKEGENICSCCKCGCGMLYLKTKYPGPSGQKWNNYYATFDQSKCVKCGACKDACGFGYLKRKKNGQVVINQEQCLGCGICASKCPTKAITLVKKADENIYIPPETYDDAIELWEKNTVKDYKNGK